MTNPLIQLTREVRFGLHPEAPSSQPPMSQNNFAGQPPLTTLAPFLTLTTTLTGQPDSRTGMLLNIKQIDEVIRQTAIPKIQNHYYLTPPPPPLSPASSSKTSSPPCTPFSPPTLSNP